MQVSRAEFVLLWATFVAIMLTDLERGILIGIIMAVLYFAYSYAQASTRSMKPPLNMLQWLSPHPRRRAMSDLH